MDSVSLKSAFLVVFFATSLVTFQFPVSLVFPLALYLCTGGYRTVFIIMKTLPRDIQLLRKAFKMKSERKRLCGNLNTISKVFEETARKHPEKHAFVCAETGEKMTFNECTHFINQIASAFQKKGYKKGDHVALLLENNIEYVPIWMGLSKIGVTTALINTSLQGKSLEHCLSVVEFKGIIYGVNLENNLKSINFFEKEDFDFYVSKSGTSSEHNAKSIDLHQFIKQDPSIVAVQPIDVGLKHPVLYIYTSGSTGKPKAVPLNQKKMLDFVVLITVIPDVHPNDIVYNTLPFYHASGSLLICGPAFYLGCTTVIRRKFSASKFISDCIKHDVTTVGYIGELWRFILAQPQNVLDRKHKIRMAIGNGLRKSLFKEVQNRFGIKYIREAYGATEGNIGFINIDNKEGAIGNLFKVFPFLNATGIVKCDAETGELIRDGDGLAIECAAGEPGMCVASILKDRQFYDGYVNNEKATKSKVAENVFKKGDKVFLTGDLLKRDEFNYLYFVDRIGDTFRWKGENVSTTEVENVISLVTTTVQNAVVYPVEIPGNEGKAGMAYLQVEKDSEFSINHFAAELEKHLPRYAIPIFVRIGKAVNTTGTFKYQKFTLKHQGFNFEECDQDEKFYVFDLKLKDYRVLDKNLFDEIQTMKMRF